VSPAFYKSRRISSVSKRTRLEQKRTEAFVGGERTNREIVDHCECAGRYQRTKGRQVVRTDERENQTGDAPALVSTGRRLGGRWFCTRTVLYTTFMNTILGGIMSVVASANVTATVDLTDKNAFVQYVHTCTVSCTACTALL
jgi:hypothetical protein